MEAPADNGSYHVLEDGSQFVRQVSPKHRSMSGSSFTGSELNHGSAGVGATITNTTKSIFGSGVLAMPHAFAAAGMVPGFILTLAIGAWSLFTIELIARCTRLVPKAATYDDLADAAFGSCGRWIGAVNLVVHQIFVCCAYIILIASNVASVAGIGNESGPYPFWMVLLLLPPFLVLVCLRDMSTLSGVSALGNLFLIASLVTILAVAMPKMSTAEWTAPVHFDVIGMTEFFGIAAFTFAGHTEVVPIYLSMATPSKYTAVVLPCVGAAALVLYAAVGSLVFCAYREDTPANVFEVMNGTPAIIAKLSMSMVVFLTLPIKLLPAVQVIEAALSISGFESGDHDGKSVSSSVAVATSLSAASKGDAPATNGAAAAMPAQRQSSSAFVHSRYQIATRIGLAAVPATIAMVLTDFGFVVEFVGAFCMGIVAFAMPPMMYLALNRSAAKPNMSKTSVLAFVGFSALGVAVTVFTTTQVVLKKVWGIKL